MEYRSSEYTIAALPDGRIDISNHLTREFATEGITLYPSEVEVFIDRLRQMVGELNESRPLL